MTQYHGVDCPICHQPLLHDTEVAVCPECGAPYHRACIVTTGACLFGDLHEKHEAWQNPNKTVESSPGEGATEATTGDVQEQPAEGEQKATSGAGDAMPSYRRCEQCGRNNPPDGLFCEDCGSALSKKTAPSFQANASAATDFSGGTTHAETPSSTFSSGTGWRSFSADNPNPVFFAPFGGLDPDSTIADIPVKDLAVFTGQNAIYFLPKFKSYADKQPTAMTFNFSAALFQSFYFFYRKMYLIGFLVFLATTILSIPAMLFAMDQMRNQFLGPAATPWFRPEDMQTLMQACSTVMIVLRVMLGSLFNRLYLRHAVAKVKHIQHQKLPQEQYVQALTKAGSVSMRVIFLTIGLLIVAGYAIAWLVLF